MIRACCEIPAYDIVRFDASPWFYEAPSAAVMALVREEWSGRPAREMAKALAAIDGYSRLGDLLDYKRRHRTHPWGKPLEIEINVDPADALAWLSAHRPRIRAAIEREYGDDALICDRTKSYWADPKDPDETKYLRKGIDSPAPGR